MTTRSSSLSAILGARAPVDGTITTSTSSRLEKSTAGLTVIVR